MTPTMFPIDLDEPVLFEDWLAMSDGTNTYKADLESLMSTDYWPATAALIEDWFFDWQIGWNDAAKFWKYLKRNIQSENVQYEEMLRIQPGYLKVDWFVQNYNERKLDSTIDSNSAIKHGDDTKTTDTTTNATSTSHTEGTDGNVRTGGETVAHTGTDTKAKTGTDTLAHTGTDTKKLTGSDTDIHTGGYTETDTEGTHTEDVTSVDGLHTQEYSPHVSKKTENGGHTSDWNGSQGLSAVNPMSKKYSSFITEAVLEDGKTPETQEGYFASRSAADMPDKMDWSTASTQQQSRGKAYHVDKTNVTESYEYGSDGQGDITTNQGSEASPDTKQTTRKGLSSDPDTKQVTYNEDTKTGNKSEDSSTEYNTKDTTGYGSTETDTADKTDKTTYDSITDAGTSASTTTGSQGSTGKNVQTDTHGDITNTGASVFADKEISTGRSADTAALLQNAKNFIARSNAWLWFREQLVPCFESEMI